MIAASDLQLFVPYGRQQIQRYVNDPSPLNHTLEYNSTNVFEFSHGDFGANKEQNSKEQWITKESGENGEEELYINGRSVVWSKGNAGVNGVNFTIEQPGVRLTLGNYYMDYEVKHVHWCRFEREKATNSSTEPNEINAICIFDEKKLSIFTSDEEDYFTRLPFKVSSAWSTKYGLLVERATPVTFLGSNKTRNVKLPEFNFIPTLFSLTHPLNELSPFLILKQGGVLSFMREHTMKVIYVSEEPSICLCYDYRNNLHTIWKIRKATNEEKDMLNSANRDERTCSNISKQLPSSSIHGFNSHSTLRSYDNRSSVSVNFPANSSPYGGSWTSSLTGATYQLSPLLAAKTLSPLSTFSRGQSSNITSPTENSRFKKMNRTYSSPYMTSSPRKSPAMEARLGSSPGPPAHSSPQPVNPELCLEYVWTENHGARREGDVGPASRAFLGKDFSGQKYFCYFIPVRQELLCAKMDKSNGVEPGLIFGTISTIQCKDAAYVTGLDMILILDMSNKLCLYSGLSCVGHVLLGGVVASSQFQPSTPITGIQSFAKTENQSPQQRRRQSLLSSTRTGEELFTDQSYHLSPVAHSSHLLAVGFSVNDMNESLMTSITLDSIYNAVGHHVTLKYSDGLYYRISLPALYSSMLVADSLKTLVAVLPRNELTNFISTWYAGRNAPGTQDISSEQEWKLFYQILMQSMGYDFGERSSSSLTGKSSEAPIVHKRQRESEEGNLDDWNFIENSLHEVTSMGDIVEILQSESTFAPDSEPDDDFYPQISNSESPLFPYVPIIHYALHILYEEMKLDVLEDDTTFLLSKLLHQLALDLNLDDYVDHYCNDYLYEENSLLVNENIEEFRKIWKDTRPSFIQEVAPDIFGQILICMKQKTVIPYPIINQVNDKSHFILQLVNLLYNKNYNHEELFEVMNSDKNLASRLSMDLSCGPHSALHKAVSFMVQAGVDQMSLQAFPIGVAWILSDVIHRCRETPALDWNEAEYKLILREDLAWHNKKYKSKCESLMCRKGCKKLNTEKTVVKRSEEFDGTDGMNDMPEEIMNMLWTKDERVNEVKKMLRSSTPIRINVVQRPELSTHEYIEEQEKYLLGISTRTTALSVGRGMFTLRTLSPGLTEPLAIPKLCLSGKSVQSGTTIDFSHIEVSPNMSLWPMFHNGAASGLRIPPNATNIDSTWILFNKPKAGTDVLPEHAGFLMALGLNGHLANLHKMNMFDYLSKFHEMTSIGVLIGVAASYRGTMDTATTKLLSLHVESLLPPTSLELDISQNVQIAALLGVGLVYQGSAHRHITEVLLAEMGRPPGPEMENYVDRESYTLTAGLALGMVLLGKGSATTGLADLNVADSLHYYMIGGHKRPLSGPQKEKYKFPSYQIREGDAVNVDVTSPGATLALGMMFFNTGNRAVADWMKCPDTQYVMDFICPDFMLVRTLARGLILWDDVLPYVEYVESQVPMSIRPYCLSKPKPDVMPNNIDLETINQAYCNIVAGACMTLGLKYAGSANNIAYSTLHYFCKIFIDLFKKSISELPGKSTIENCLNVILVSLAMVMAGTGELEVLRFCYGMRARVSQAPGTVVTYGSHLATHIAMGLLFLGGGRYTLSTSPEAIAAMIVAFYPKYPTHSNDNRYHLQAFRHLYVLAVECRLILPRDIDTGIFTTADVSIIYEDTKHYQNQSTHTKAPVVLPELKYLKQVQVSDARYWPIIYNKDKNWNQLENILKNGLYFDVKKRIEIITDSFQKFPDSRMIWTTTPEDFLYLLADRTVVDLASELLITIKGDDDFGKNNQLCKMKNLSNLILQECVIRDKTYLLSLWIATVMALSKMWKYPTMNIAWQMELTCERYGCKYADERSGGRWNEMASSQLFECFQLCANRCLERLKEVEDEDLSEQLAESCHITDEELITSERESEDEIYDQQPCTSQQFLQRRQR